MAFPLIPLLAAAPALVDAGFRIAGAVNENNNGGEKGGNRKTPSAGTSAGGGGLQTRRGPQPGAGPVVAGVRRVPGGGSGTGTPRPWPNRPTLPPMDDEQRASMQAIINEVARADLGPLTSARTALTLALIVNAWAESGLRPDAWNPGRPGLAEDSVGLFQVNRRAHSGFSREQLANPGLNTRVLLEIIRRDKRFQQLVARGGTVGDLAVAVTLWAERPVGARQKGIERATTLLMWWPEARGRRALELAT